MTLPEKSRSNRTSRSIRRALGAALTGTLLLVIAPASATAASAFVTQSFEPNGRSTATAQFLGAPGETNDVRVHELSRERFDFSDANNGITPGKGCRRRGRSVRCDPRSLRPAPTNVAPARVRLGDLDDEALITGGRATLNGGSGNDTLTTNARTVNTTLLGGFGNDILAVSPNTTVGHTLRGNFGNDTITGGPSGDAISGGFGNDSVTALGGSDEVDGDDGDDTITGGTGPDQLLGGDGDDRLFGNSGRDRLRGQNGSDGLAGGANNDRIGGGPGRDRLFGNDSNDLLVGNSGRDRYWGGPGNDRVRALDGIRERVNCGTGFDRALVDRMPRDVTAFCNEVRRVTYRR